jgi:hypothetical protein
MKKSFSSIFFLFILVFGFAQNNNVNQYFDDGGISSRKNVVSLNLGVTIKGTPTIHYERAFGDVFTCDVNAGIITQNFKPGHFESGEGVFPDTVSSGFSYGFNPRFYVPLIDSFLERLFNMKTSALHGYYIGLLYRDRHVETNDNTLLYKDGIFNMGIQFFIKERIACDVHYGVGFLIKNNTNISETSLYRTQLAQFKIGYVF